MKQFDCIDCGVNTHENDEYYMVHDHVWLEANPKKDGMLCIGCLEARLGRKLVATDFTGAPINKPDESMFTFSDRFLNRISHV